MRSAPRAIALKESLQIAGDRHALKSTTSKKKASANTTAAAAGS
jgi:hypothetical protein